jgi:hypothetical protein
MAGPVPELVPEEGRVRVLQVQAPLVTGRSLQGMPNTVSLLVNQQFSFQFGF